MIYPKNLTIIVPAFAVVDDPGDKRNFSQRLVFMSAFAILHANQGADPGCPFLTQSRHGATTFCLIVERTRRRGWVSDCPAWAHHGTSRNSNAELPLVASVGQADQLWGIALAAALAIGSSAPIGRVFVSQIC